MTNFDPRPRIHFTAQKNWINDPNGCVYLNGKYHLFFQHHPHSMVWGPMHWGHAQSSDLLQWEELGIALYPDKETGMAFSGSIIIDTNNSSQLFPSHTTLPLLALYTRHRNLADNSVLQEQYLSYSLDEGKTWEHFDGNPILPNPGNSPDFRDPKVFYHSESQHWIMVLACGRELRFYRSPNLLDWEFTSSFSKMRSGKKAVYECPDCLRLRAPTPKGEHWVLVTSELSETEKIIPTQYILGHFDGRRFIEDNPEEDPRRVDYGKDFYAVQSWHNTPDGRKVWTAWANYWSYANTIPSANWRGTLNLPRELSLVEGEPNSSLQLSQLPVQEVNALRCTPINLILHDEEFCVTKTPLEPGFPYDFNFVIKKPLQGNLELCISAVSGEHREVLSLNWDGNSATFTCDRSGLELSSFNEHFAEDMSVNLSDFRLSDKPLRFRIVLDNSIVEVFLQNGQRVLSALVFPKTAFNEFSCYYKGGLELVSALCYPLFAKGKQ